MDRKRIKLAVLLATFLAALDGTMVATAGPVIARGLSGLNLYPWMLAGFMAAAAIATPVFGRISDIFRRDGCTLWRSVFLRSDRSVARRRRTCLF